MESPTLFLKIFVYVGWIASCLSMCLALGVRASQKLTKWLEKIPLSPWSFSTTALAVGTYLLILSQEMSGIVKYDGNVPVIDSVLNTIRLFGARGGNIIQNDVLKLYLSPRLCSLYEVTHSLARLAAPVDTLMGVFILVNNFLSNPKLRFDSVKRDTFVFSKLSEQSLMIATSIADHYEKTPYAGDSKRCLIAFANTANMKNNPLIEKALSRGMICVGPSISMVYGHLTAGTRRRVLVVAGDNEMNNLHDGMDLVQKLIEHEKELRKRGKKVRTPEVHIISTSPSADTFIDAACAQAQAGSAPGETPLVAVRRIDRQRSTIESFLWDYPLFLVSKPGKGEAPGASDPLYTNERRRIAIVGSGDLAREFLKAAVWCSQMDGISFSIDVIDKTVDQTRSKLALDAPEVLRLNGDGPGALYHINFLPISAETGEYLDYLHTNRDELTYLIIALGDNLLNVRVARRTREILEQGRYEADRSAGRAERPLICAIISDKRLAGAVAKMTTGRGDPYDIVPIGIDADTSSYENLFMPDIDLMGRNVNRAYWGYYDLKSREGEEAQTLRSQADASYERFEYNRRSSRATAIHLKYNLFCYVRRSMLAAHDGEDVPAISTEQWQGDLAKFTTSDKGTVPLGALVERFDQYVKDASWEQLHWLSSMEHDRWCAYLRTEGYEVADEQTFGAFFDQTHENQNRLSKQHVCLVPFADLQATSDYVYARSQKASDQDYEHLDDVIVLHLKDIANDRERSN